VDRKDWYLDPGQAQVLLEGLRNRQETVRVSFDLGLSERVLSIEEEDRWDRARLQAIASSDCVWQWCGEDWEALEIREDHYLVLRPTEDAPALEIDGITMHRRSGTTPWSGVREWVRALRLRGGETVLDCCGGLGYAAISLIEAGAEAVTSFEIDEDVIRLRRRNPWSRLYERSDRIDRRCGDVGAGVATLADATFQVVLHDPPRLRRAGDLYGRVFYEQLRRVLTAPGGRLFHYTGEPHSRHRPKRIVEGVVRRLEEAGFQRVRFRREWAGVLAYT
jgi:hypothetical protein